MTSGCMNVGRFAAKRRPHVPLNLSRKATTKPAKPKGIKSGPLFTPIPIPIPSAATPVLLFVGLLVGIPACVHFWTPDGIPSARIVEGLVEVKKGQPEIQVHDWFHWIKVPSGCERT